MKKKCNIDKTDRHNRIVLGVIIIIAAILGLSKLFYLLLGLILIAEGVIGWCGIPIILAKGKELLKKMT